MKRFLWLGFVALGYVICSGCGDTFRPIIIPNPPTFPSPRAAHSVVSINDNGTFVAGSAMVIDVSGGSDVSVHDADVHPVHAVQLTASSVLVVNQAATNLDQPALPIPLLTRTCNVTYPPTPPPPLPPPPNQQVYNVCPSITKLNFNSTVISSSNTISLPPYSGSNFVAGAPTDNFAYVTMPTYPPDPTQPAIISPSVGVISTLSNSLTTIIPVGKNPIALAVTPDKSKLYVANNGDSTISGFDTADRSARVISPANTANPPIWLVPRTDNQRVYVLEEGGALDSIDTTSTAGPDTLTPSGITVPGATTITYDPNLNRLYLAGGNPGFPELAIIDVSQSAPSLLATISLPPFPLVNSNPSSVPSIAVAATALPDGSRAYVGSYAVLPTQVSISSVVGDGTNATFTYTLVSGHDLTPGVSVTIAGMPAALNGFNGTFLVGSSVSGTTSCAATCFQLSNPTVFGATTVAATGTGTNIFPQVTVIWTASNTIKTTISLPGFPDATVPSPSPYYVPACVNGRFRFMMAAAGDSSASYLSSCDGGIVNIVDTSNDSYSNGLLEPIGTRQPTPPSTLNPPQSPVFLLAGP
jgi:DNA-binding beta-propeller fold protein YncE